MNGRSIIPSEPPRPAHSPMVYVRKEVIWQYKQIMRNLGTETPLNEEELNQLGGEGWEMAGIVEKLPQVYFYFKRQVEK